MAVWKVSGRRELLTAAEQAQPGDRIEAESLPEVAGSVRELLPVMEMIDRRGADFVCSGAAVDTRGEGRANFFGFCRALAELDRQERRENRRSGIERAKADGKYKGRKPIAVDETLFDSVVALWRDGQITAREAMARLELKPNTFYRRIKEQEERKMKDYKKMEKDIREGIREAAKQSREDLHELKKQVRAEAEEVKQAAGEALEMHDVERELRRDRRRAESEHQEAVRRMKKDVEAETKELKKLMDEA